MARVESGPRRRAKSSSTMRASTVAPRAVANPRASEALTGRRRCTDSPRESKMRASTPEPSVARKPLARCWPFWLPSPHLARWRRIFFSLPLPTIASSFDVPTAATGSLMSSFFATFALGQLFVGPLADRYGRRPADANRARNLRCRQHRLRCCGDAPHPGRRADHSGRRRLRILRSVASDRPGPVLRKRVGASSLLHHGGDGGSAGLLAASRRWPGLCVRLARSFCIRRAVRTFARHLAYAFDVGETHHAARAMLDPIAILRGYVSLLRDRRFIVPAASVSMVIGGLFAVFTVTPAILVDGLGFTPLALEPVLCGNGLHCLRRGICRSEACANASV